MYGWETAKTEAALQFVHHTHYQLGYMLKSGLWAIHKLSGLTKDSPIVVMRANELSNALLNAIACCWVHIARVRKFDTGSDLLSQPCRTLEQFMPSCASSMTSHCCLLLLCVSECLASF